MVDISVRVGLKEKILQTCIKVQEATIENLKSEVDENQNSANEYGPPKDRYDSFRTQLLAKRDMFAHQLAKANEQLDILKRIPADKDFKNIEFGAVVVTEKQKMFVSVGIGKINVEGESYYAISPAVPVFKAMEGKKAGDEYQFNGIKTKILDVF